MNEDVDEQVRCLKRHGRFKIGMYYTKYVFEQDGEIKSTQS
jgi:hypothetical protein